MEVGELLAASLFDLGTITSSSEVLFGLLALLFVLGKLLAEMLDDRVASINIALERCDLFGMCVLGLLKLLRQAVAIEDDEVEFLAKLFRDRLLFYCMQQ